MGIMNDLGMKPTGKKGSCKTCKNEKICPRANTEQKIYKRSYKITGCDGYYDPKKGMRIEDW